MKDADDYLAYVKALVVAHPLVVHWAMLREEAQGNVGLLRYRLTLSDGSLLELFERFQIVDGQAQVGKYRFHWQDSAGHLRQRWDNAAHHPELSTLSGSLGKKGGIRTLSGIMQGQVM
jgi:hypothetical protein